MSAAVKSPGRRGYREVALALERVIENGPRENRLDRRTEDARDRKVYSAAKMRIRARHLSRVAKVNAYYAKTHGPFRRHAILRRQATGGVTF